MTWVSLLEFAVKNGVSLSTLRRHIKAKKLQYKTEGGKYWVLDSETGLPPERNRHQYQHYSQKQERNRDQTPNQKIFYESNAPQDYHIDNPLMKLKNELNKANEEIVELKTLIAYYEELLNSGEIGVLGPETHSKSSRKTIDE